MILHATLEQTPADSTEGSEQITRETTVEAPTYDEAWARLHAERLHAELPEGWRVPWVRSA